MSKSVKIIILLLLALTSLFFLLWLTPSYSIEISSQEQSPKKNTASIFQIFQPKEKESVTNILLLGKPGPGYPGGELTDTIIIAHLNPEENSLMLISLPRDLLVKIPNRNGFTKINSLYNLVGIKSLKEKVEEITNLSIDYHVLIDLAVVKEVINLIDGLNIFVPQDINDPYFPGPNHSYQTFTLQSGWRYLDGENALKYIRTRYTSPNGDFDRMSRQQQVIRLVKQKVLSLDPLWNFLTYFKIFNSLQSHIETDIELNKMKSFWQIAKDIDLNKMTTIVIDKKDTGLLVGGQVMFNQQAALMVWPKAGRENYDEIKNFIRQIMNKEL